MSLTRERIVQGWIQRMLAAEKDGIIGEILTEEQLLGSRRDCLARVPASGEVWVFGYGSLIWNPCFDYVERRSVVALGWHRRFCLWTHLGRGTPDFPGLVLGLEPGGRCTGVAFKLSPEQIDTELDVIWRREMVTAAYRPVWAQLDTEEGRIQGIAFAMNRKHLRYAGRLNDEQIADTIARAAGSLGPCCDYLFNTSQHLDELGLGDPGLRRLCREVRKLQAAAAWQAPAA